MRELTDNERLTNAETMRHILTVRTLLAGAASRLLARANAHDTSKLSDPEVESFAKHTAALAKLEYGSDEYRAELKQMKPAIQHHYEHNRHHPEFHPNGLDDMNLFDLVEMLCDWKAAGLRHETGSLAKSMTINADRFAMPPFLVRLLNNTVPVIEKLGEEAQVAVSYPHVDDDA